MFVQGGLSIERMCRLADVSRAGFYRSCEAKMPAEDELKVKALVQEIALEHRQRYGYRRVTAELHRRGLVANHKRVARIMREDNLLNIRAREGLRKSETRRTIRGTPVRHRTPRIQFGHALKCILRSRVSEGVKQSYTSVELLLNGRCTRNRKRYFSQFLRCAVAVRFLS
jgi:HTH-like domain